MTPNHLENIYIHEALLSKGIQQRCLPRFPEKSPLKKYLQINLNICGFSDVFILKRKKKYG